VVRENLRFEGKKVEDRGVDGVNDRKRRQNNSFIDFMVVKTKRIALRIQTS